MNNLGYACINMTLGKKGILTGRAMRKSTLDAKGLPYASQLALQNAKDLKTILEWNGKIIADKTLNNSNYKKIGLSAGQAKKQGAKPLNGFQLRYIYLIDKTCK